MAENKLSWSELRRALATREGVSEKMAGAFLTSFQTQLIEALKIDKSVKVNGLGTFKLQAVAPRKSVNISTGEEITIAGYNKIVFVPEAGLKEMVEKGQSELGETAKALHLNEPVVDPLKKLGEQAEEIVGILGELGQSPNKGERKEPEEPKSNTGPVEKEIEMPDFIETEIKEPVIKKGKKKKKKKKYHFMRDTLICVVILLMVLLAGYFFMRSQLSYWIEQFMHVRGDDVPRVEQVEPAPEAVVAEEPVVEQEPIVEPEVIEKQEVKQEPKKPEVKQEPKKKETPKVEKQQEGTYSEILTVEEIAPGSRLTWIAKKHYGDKRYWPYLYDANRDRLPNPSMIPVGTPIRVPKLTRAQKDTTLASTRERLEQLRLEAERASGK